MMKKITAVILSLAAVWNLGLRCAGAADNQKFIAGVYQENEDRLHLLCAMPQETGEIESFQVSLGDQELPVLSVSTAGQEQLPKTVYCLVDISGSMKGRMDQAKEVLYAISGGLNVNDNLVIGKMGNQITDSVFFTVRDDIKAEIDSLAYTGEDTDLYSGLIHGLKFLKQGTAVHEMKVLVVISDGCDDQGAGSTWKEAYDAVGKADIPVYTAAMILSSADYEPAKDLGSFARNSAGGVHFPQSDGNGSEPAGMTGQEIGEGILSAMADTLHLTVDLSGVQRPNQDTCLISVSCESQDGKVCRDSREMAVRELSFSQETAGNETEAKTEPLSSEAEPEPVPEQDAAIQRYLPYLAGGGLVLIAAITVLAVSFSKKKKRREAERRKKEQEEQERQERERQEQERRELLAREEQLRQEQKEQELALQKAREEAERREQEAFNALPRLNIRMSVIGRRDTVVNIQLVKGYEMTVGRTAKSRIILNPQDSRLSGVHFIMFWDGGSVYLWDEQSKNGTAVNGVVVNHLGRVAVKPGDSVRAGSYEYRLYWEE